MTTQYALNCLNPISTHVYHESMLGEEGGGGGCHPARSSKTTNKATTTGMRGASLITGRIQSPRTELVSAYHAERLVRQVRNNTFKSRDVIIILIYIYYHYTYIYLLFFLACRFFSYDERDRKVLHQIYIDIIDQKGTRTVTIETVSKASGAGQKAFCPCSYY